MPISGTENHEFIRKSLLCLSAPNQLSKCATNMQKLETLSNSNKIILNAVQPETRSDYNAKIA